MPRIPVDLPEEHVAWLNELAKREGRSRASILSDAVKKHIQKWEMT